LEAVLGALDGGHAVFYPSGMGAVTAALEWLRPSRIALPEEEVYHGVRRLVSEGAAEGKWELGVPRRLGSGDVQWLETPSNPRTLITDVAAAAAAAHAQEAVAVVDATFATPVLLTPLTLGADVVMHSATKYLGGHSDAMGGVLVVRDEDAAVELRRRRARDGLVPGSLETWLTLRGLRTLPVRMRRQSDTAAAVARWLSARVPTVWYPGLESHPGHAVAAAQMTGFGAVVSFELHSAAEAAAVVDRLELFRIATSLGGVESLAEHRIDSDPDVPPGLIRLSVGLESPDALIADLEKALR
jgi:cystathionine gamma-synthase